MNVDHANDHGAFIKELAPIKMSNLCLTGDAMLQIMHTDGQIDNISLLSFVESFEYGGMNGVKVKSYDTVTEDIIWASVSAAAKTNTVDKLIEIEDENGKIIRCTPEHQIWTKNRGWVAAQDLLETDLLCNDI